MKFRAPLIVLAALALAACVYRIDIQQGNLLDDDDIDQVDVGMTRSQVQFLLGTPMVADSFHRDRWDYAYYFRQRPLARRRPALGRRPFRERPRRTHRARSRAGAVDLTRAAGDITCPRHRLSSPARRTPSSATPRAPRRFSRTRHRTAIRVTSKVSVKRDVGAAAGCRRESPFAAQSPERPRHEVDADALGPLKRIARPEALMETEHADVERRLDRVALREIDPSTSAPVQEFRIALDVVDEIEHLLRRVRNARAALALSARDLLFRAGRRVFLAMILGSLRTHDQERDNARRARSRRTRRRASTISSRTVSKPASRCRAGKSRACAPAKRS